MKTSSRDDSASEMLFLEGTTGTVVGKRFGVYLCKSKFNKRTQSHWWRVQLELITMQFKRQGSVQDINVYVSINGLLRYRIMFR